LLSRKLTAAAASLVSSNSQVLTMSLVARENANLQNIKANTTVTMKNSNNEITIR